MKNTTCLVFVFGFLFATSAFAAVRLASPFTDHMVLQRDMAVPVWGWAEAGERVKVSFAGQEQVTRADEAGSWRVMLAPLEASAVGRALMVRGADDVVALRDVLVGEVWLCSGQSNMDFTVAKTKKYYYAGVENEGAEVAAADHPRIRMFTGEWQLSYEPQKTVGGEWKVCTPENVGEFSAVGYFFARDLQQRLRVPVGIVTMTLGASCAQAWISREAIGRDAALKVELDKFDAQVKAYAPPAADELREWEEAAAKAKAEGRRAPRKPKPDPVKDQHNPTVLFNGMIAPIVPYAIRGVLWYQGESITEPKALFPKWNEALITEWRGLWKTETLPFYFVQLAAHKAASNSPQVREWQAEALKLPDTAMAVTIDIGDFGNVHPKNKQDVGARLALIARAKTYGEKVESSGPVIDSKTVRAEGDVICVEFTHARGGLVARDGRGVKTVEVAGADGKFVAAEAWVDEKNPKMLRARATGVEAPVAVRYAWANFPEGCNLYNKAGLPAAPFAAGR